MRKIFFISLSALSCLFTSEVFAQTENDDPDLPKFMFGLTKEQYLLARQNYFFERLGDPSRFLYNPRSVATEKVKQMELQQRGNTTLMIQTPNWVQLGPSPIPNGQTTTVSTPVSGRITAIAVHPTNANIVYIGCANGGVYRSMNSGTTWTQIFTGAQSFAIGALALAPSDPTILYVGTGEPQNSGDSYAGVGLYRIDNADASPTLVGPINPVRSYNDASSNPQNVPVFNFRAISKILVDPANAANVFVSTTSGVQGNPGSSAGGGFLPPLAIRGIYRSTNATSAAGSVTFTKLTVETLSCSDNPCTGNATVSDMIMDPTNSNNILVWVNNTNNASTTLGGGLYKSTNALGATPGFTKTYFPTNSSVRGEFAIANVGGNVVVYAGTGEATNGKILRSVDGGGTWIATTGSYTFCNGQCFYDIAMAVDPTNAGKVYIGGSSGSNLFRRSTDSVNTVPVTGNAVGLHADVHAIVIAPSDPKVVYLSSDGGIFKSSDSAKTWTSLNVTGLNATQFQSLALHPTDINFTIGGTQDNGTNMLKPDGTFNRVDFGDGGYALIDQNATNTTAVSMYHTYFNQVNNLVGYARIDNGTSATEGTWNFYGCSSNVTANGIPCTGSVNFYAPMALGPGNPNTVYYGANILYRSTDKGVNNTAVSQAVSTISTIAIAPQDDNYRIVGLNNGDVFATITGSSTLVTIKPSPGSTFPVGRVFISPANKNVAYVCYTGYFNNGNAHIYKTTNLNDLGGTGVTWTAIGTGLPDVPVNSFTMTAINPNILFAGTDIGVFISNDAGATWSSYNGGVLPAVPVFDMAIHPVSHVLRIATHGIGLWETSVTLPVSFTEFTATVKEKTKVFLEWFTATETNNKGFEIERALVARNTSGFVWEKVGFVNGSGTTTSPRRYQFEDVPVGGKKFIYRLRQIDYDNNFKYSDQRQVTLNNFDFALYPAYPNPIKLTGSVRYQIPDDGQVTLALYNSNGALVRYIVNEKKDAGIYQVAINTNGLASGTYYVQLKTGIYFDSKSLVIIQ